MKTRTIATFRTTLSALVLAAVLAPAWAADNPFLGHWALTIPGGGAGWLGIKEVNGKLEGSILWGGGSVVPVATVALAGDQLVVTRIYESRRKDASGATVRTRETETIKATRSGDQLNLTTQRTREGSQPGAPASFTGQRIPPLPPAPNLAQVKFGAPVTLFNGKDLTGWRLTNPKQASGWSVQDGVLINRPVQEDGKPHVSYGNLRTEQEFEDFKLTLETRVPKGGNSGIYLRGIYEVQVAESYGKQPDSHGMGGLYSRITPTVNAAKPAGEWQTLDLTLVNRHLTVVLNGQTIIDNAPVLGCTGGALWSDEFRPGPLYLQGDHTGVDYRNMILRPVVK